MDTEFLSESGAGGERGLSNRVFDDLLQAIYSGRIGPGEAINEAVEAKRLNVSRGPVREAVNRLQGIGLLTRVPYVKARVITLDSATVLELFEFRMALEGMACRLATERISETELEELEHQLDAYRRNPIAMGERFDFHARIAQACRNTRLSAALNDDTFVLLKLYRSSSGSVPERKDTAYDEHRQILMAMKSRNKELAESLMRSHIGRAAEHVRSQMTTRQG
ncbi:GntR family transcriptional regulator [Bordetella genomosp. 5]|uniref:HTH gntR-type domain-containing protein n=1 Tax=Bordetella genomosp. 5 TaxID=1395608 RepID=A0A261TW63_9BORD|nr:GntR family transcriptional regulator [Bordetella genomosp. 5]OZI53645.1 hypothetical protein CAL25_06635 [Bordetella genomosp. 5]